MASGKVLEHLFIALILVGSNVLLLSMKCKVSIIHASLDVKNTETNNGHLFNEYSHFSQ